MHIDNTIEMHGLGQQLLWLAKWMYTLVDKYITHYLLFFTITHQLIIYGIIIACVHVIYSGSESCVEWCMFEQVNNWMSTTHQLCRYSHAKYTALHHSQYSLRLEACTLLSMMQPYVRLSTLVLKHILHFLIYTEHLYYSNINIVPHLKNTKIY